MVAFAIGTKGTNYIFVNNSTNEISQQLFMFT